MGIRDLLKRIAKWGVLPVLGVASSTYGVVSAAQDASTWGLPAYAWVAVGWVLFTAVPITFACGQWRDNQKLRAELEGKLDEQRKVFAIPDQLLGATLSNLDIKVGDLTRADDFVRSKVFNKCHIYGPAVLLPQGSNTLFTKCIFDGETERFLITTTNERVFGVINLYDCIFKECVFHHIGIMGNAETIKKMRNQIQPLPRQKDKSG